MSEYVKMREKKHTYKSKKISVFDFCLLCLSFIQFVSNITLFADNTGFSVLQALIETMCYILLIYIISQKKYTIKALIGIAIVTCLLTYGMYNSRMSAFVFAWLLIVASKGKKYEHLIKKVYKSMLAALIVAIVCYFCTLNLEIFRKELGSGLTLSLGQKNQAGLFLAYLYLMRKTWKKQSGKLYKEWLYAIVVFLITRSKTATAVIFIYPLLKKLFQFALLRRKKWMKMAIELLVPVLFIFNYFCAKKFLVSGFVQILDKIMTNRIFLNWFILSKNNLTLWGQNIQLIYTGVHNPVRNTWNITTTVDNMYILSILVMGIIPTIIFILGYVKLIEVAWKERKVEVIVMAVIFALYGMSEVKTINIFFNFVYLYINCYHGENVVQRKKR